MNRHRAQAAFGFVSYFALFLLVFVVGVAYITTEEVREIKQREGSLAKEIAFGLASEIHFAARAGDGYSRDVSIPKRIGGASEYNMYVRDGFLILNWSRGEGSFEVLAPLSTANMATRTLAYAGGYMEINASKGFVRLKNIGGTVYVDQ